VELVSYRAFKRGARSGAYKSMNLVFIQNVGEGETRDTQLNFTHRASHGDLGHGDSTTLQREAREMLHELKDTHSAVF